MHPPLYPFLDSRLWVSFGTKCLQWTESDIATAKLLLKKRQVPILRGPEIGVLLGVSARLVARASACPERYYTHFKIPKKSGKFRSISAPRVYLKVIQRYLLDCILARVRLADGVIGFVRGHNMSDGARRHVGARFLWNIDLKDFFPSVTLPQVTAIYLRLGYPEHSAAFLARLCCLTGRLPQGAPTSPMLANLSFAEADSEIAQLSKNHSVTYTRYADDLSFSSQNPIAADFRDAVFAVIMRHGFQINHEKTRLVGPRCRREVTGLTVNTRVSVPRQIRRNIRAMMHNYSRSVTSIDKTPEQVRGLIAYIGNHHPEEACRYLKILAKK